MLTLFNDFSRENFTEAESNNEPTHNPYTAIVLNPDENAFKVISGVFKDKKDVYEKLAKKGYVVRKVLETSIFNWIEKNAKNNLEAYAMFSTAFSKWRGNNLLSDYYVKLLNDIPQLNRERQKGNPNSKGKTKDRKESVLSEDQRYYKAPEVDTEYASKHDLLIYPIGLNGERDPKYANNPISTTIYTFENANRQDYTKRFDDPNFYRLMFRLMKIDAIGGGDYRHPIVHPAFEIVVDNNFKNPDRITSRELLSQYQSKNKSPTYKWIPDDSPRATMLAAIKRLQDSLQKAKEEGTADEVKALTYQLNDLNRRYGLEVTDKTPYYTSDEQKRIKELKKQIFEINSEKLPPNISKQEIRDIWAERSYKIADLKLEIEKIKEKANERIKANARAPISNVYKAELASQLDDMEAQLDKNQSIVPANPRQGGDSEGNFLDQLDRKRQLQDKIKKLLDKKNSKEPVKLKKDKEERILGTLTLNANQAKKLGYDSSLDMSPYRKKNEATVNQGVDVMYNTQGLGGNPMDVYPTSNGVLPVVGTFLEDTTHNELNPELFEGNKLKSDVREALLNIADKYKESLELPFEPIDIYFTGSCANYNYNDKSDIDLHLVYDFENAGINAEILSKYLQSAKKVFNDKYDITIKGIPVEIGAENSAEPLVTSGIYSVMNDNWVKEPTEKNKEIVEPEEPYFQAIVNEIEKAIQSQDSQVIGDLWKRLGQLRKDSLAQEGEFGAGNMMFKKLRNEEFLTRLKDAYYNSVSQDLSLEALEEII